MQGAHVLPFEDDSAAQSDPFLSLSGERKLIIDRVFIGHKFDNWNYSSMLICREKKTAVVVRMGVFRHYPHSRARDYSGRILFHGRPVHVFAQHWTFYPSGFSISMGVDEGK